MPDIQLIITNAGANALAQVGQFGPVTLSTIAVGTGQWNPDATATQLQNQIATFPANGSVAIAEGMIHITAEDTSGAAYTAYEAGIFTSAGILFAIASSNAAILTKTAGSFALFACDFIISGLPPNAVTVGQAAFQYPPATQETQGVAEIATQAEVNAGQDDSTIVTPATLKGWATQSGFLEAENNLSDVDNVATARGNLGLGTAAQWNVPVAPATNANAGQVVIGSDTRLNANNWISAVLQFLFPVGEIYITHRAGNPSVLLGFGTWVPYGQGQTLVGCNPGDPNFGTLDQTGGEVTHTLTTDEMPTHNHAFSNASIGEWGNQVSEGTTVNPIINGVGGTLFIRNAGGVDAHNNLQPYTVVYFWRRTA